MISKYMVGILSVAVVGIGSLNLVADTVPVQIETVEQQYIKTSLISNPIVITESEEDIIIKSIMKDLRLCESGNKDSAVNPRDLDGTPSYGAFQFKPGTLYGFGIQFGILPEDMEPAEVMNVILDYDIQELVVFEMIKEYGRSEKFWLSQFPQCSRMYRFWSYF